MVQVMVVDDDQGTVEGYARTLRAEGFAVETARSARNALANMARARFHLVMADLDLPDMSGLRLIEMARTQRFRTPFVITTGVGSCRSAVDAMRAGAVDCVEKPLSGDERVAGVRCALKRGSPEATDPATSRHVTPHAARRWAQFVVKILDSPSDLRTIDAWAHYAAVSVGVLKSLCRLAHVSPRRSLILARLIRALIDQQQFGLSLEDLLDVRDRRTIASWLTLAGVSQLDDNLDTFLTTQQIVPDRALVTELQRSLRTVSFATGTGSNYPAAVTGRDREMTI